MGHAQSLPQQQPHHCLHMNCDVAASKILWFGGFFLLLDTKYFRDFWPQLSASQFELDLESGNISPSCSNSKTAPCAEHTG